MRLRIPSLKRNSTLALLALLILAGCNAEPRIDASSDKTLKDSLKKMDEKLTEKKKQELAHATMILAMPQMTSAAPGSPAPKPTQDSVYKSLDGMTADEIIAKAKQQAESAKGKRP